MGARMLTDLFRAARARSITQNGVTVLLYDVISIATEARIRVEFSPNPRAYRQGIWIGEMQLNTGMRVRTAGVEGPSFTLWTDTAPSPTLVEVYAPKRRLVLYNIWEEHGHQFSQKGHAGMVVEEAGGGRVRSYRCNSRDAEEQFGDLALRVTVE
jgi:hypothetical protein